MNATQTTLGIGICSLSEAAFYAKVDHKAIARWVFGDSDGRPVFDRQLRESVEKTITFLDLVQVLAVRQVRTRYGVSLQKFAKVSSARLSTMDSITRLPGNMKFFCSATPKRQDIGSL